MSYNQKALIHNPESFTRKVLMQRLTQTGFNNISRMELFLWDMELYLQIQELLKDKIVLKGGAAAQFYVPIQYQRTSVDIDMIYYGYKNEVENALKIIEVKFNGQNELFKFELHKPARAKTNLPLYTYFVKIPSVCTDQELFGKKSAIQELKIEFFLAEQKLDMLIVKSPQIFAVDTDKSYQILTLDKLIGDKLTTLGPNTIGIQEERSDEVIKQIYDINNLIHFNFDKLKWRQIFNCYKERAIAEATQRKIKRNLKTIINDVLIQTDELSKADIYKNDKLIKSINDFQGLYLRKSLTKNISAWAIIGSQLNLLFSCFNRKTLAADKYIQTIKTAKMLHFYNYQGREKGEMIRRFKNEFLIRFKKYCPFEVKEIKGKNSIRVFWILVNFNNCDEINDWVSELL